MTQQQSIQLFEEKKVRTVWDEEQEKWYFSIVDTIAVLTDSVDATAYWRKLKMTDTDTCSDIPRIRCLHKKHRHKASKKALYHLKKSTASQHLKKLPIFAA